MNINFFLCEEKQFSCGVYSSRFTAKSTESSRTPPLIAYPNSVQARVSLSLCLPTSLTLFARMRRQRACCTGLLSNRSGSSSCRVGLRATQKWWRCKGSNRMQCRDPHVRNDGFNCVVVRWNVRVNWMRSPFSFWAFGSADCRSVCWARWWCS